MQYRSGLRRQQHKRGQGTEATVSFAKPTRSFGPVTDPFSSMTPQEGQEHTGHVAQFRHTLDRISIYPPVPGGGRKNALGQPERVQAEAGKETIAQEGEPLQKVADLGSVQENQTEAGKEPIAQEGEPLQKVADNDPAQENRTGLPDDLKAGVETLSGMSLNHVRVHYNSAKPAQVQALAYTQGNEIHVGPGQEKHLPHETWHAVQQMQGRVRPTIQAKGVAINDDQGLEKEADIMGSEAEHIGNADENIEQVTERRQNRASGSPMQLKALVGVSRYLDRSGSWDTSTDGKGRVTKMEATNLKLAAGSTSVAPVGTNEPTATASPPGWAKIVSKGLTGKAPYYKRMHLLNGRLGGSGTNENLTPGSGSLNSHHSVHCENPIIKEIQAGNTVDYTVNVTYNSSSAIVASADADDWESCAFNIEGKIDIFNPSTVTHSHRTFEAEEDPGLDGSWK